MKKSRSGIFSRMKKWSFQFFRIRYKTRYIREGKFFFSVLSKFILSVVGRNIIYNEKGIEQNVEIRKRKGKGAQTNVVTLLCSGCYCFDVYFNP